MYGYIYLTTNLVNGNRYIGQHKSQNVKDDYIGSGILLTKAIKKYGKENFIKNILCTCNNREELNEKEKYYINFFDAVNSPDYYNIASGGEGGLNCTKEHLSQMLSGEKNPMYGKHHSEEARKKCSEAAKRQPHLKGVKKMSESAKKKLSEAHKGMKASDETKAKMSEMRKGRKWVNNGVVTKWIPSNELTSYLADGWVTGRIIKNKEA